MATDVTRIPDRNVVNLTAPARGDDGAFTVKWVLPEWATDADNPGRVGGYDIWWDVYWMDIRDPSKNGSFRSKRYREGASTSSDSFHPAGFFDTAGKPHTRAYWYPYTTRLVTYVAANVRTTNVRGAIGSWQRTQSELLEPAPPDVGEITQDEETGTVNITVKGVAGEGLREAADMLCRMTVNDSRRQNNPVYKQDWAPAAGTTIPLSYDVEDRMGLGYGEYVKVRLECTCRGFRGNSPMVPRVLFVGWPAQPTVSGVSVPSRDGTSKVTVRIDTNAPKGDGCPTTGVRLEKLVNVDYAVASEIPGDAAWEEVGAVDNGECKALSVTVSDILPSAGKRTWLRVKAWNEHESIFYRYSAPVRVTGLETPAPTGEDDDVTIVSAIPAEDGRSAAVTVAWDPDGTDDSTGTELSWSASEHAWRSNDGPETFSFTFDDGPVTHKGVSYRSHATAYVNGLSEGTTYHIKARRYLDGEDGAQTFGAYCEPVTCTPVTAPRSVTLTAPPFVPEGSDVPLSWTFDSDAEQRAWQVMSGDIVVASGTDAGGSCVVPASRMAGLAGSAGSVPLSVMVGTGGELVSSETLTVAIAQPPTLSVSAATVTAQPLAVSLTCDSPAEVAVVVSACGASGVAEVGMADQQPGETVWSASLVPAWSGTAGSWAATLSAPEGLDLRDGAAYDVTATATDRQTGLDSQVAACSVGVAYAHVAQEPVGATVTASDATDADGTRTIAADVALPSDGYAAGDLMDVWRVTRDGSELIAEGVAPGSVVTDPYAPYGPGTSYRVATRTQDGSVAWRDYAYQLACSQVRIDFGGSYVELPHNLTISSGWSKGFEARRHLDGSVDGYWDTSVERTGKVGSVLVGPDDPMSGALRELSRHAGPCFVRTPDGEAYEADVEVDGLDRKRGDGMADVSLLVRAVSLSGDFMAIVPQASE